MATKLKNLKIKKVDFVDEGANPDAHIRMIKSKDGEGQGAEAEERKDPDSILKKLFGFIGKAAGMDQGEIDSVVDEIEKGSAMSFAERINAVNNGKIADEMWDVCYALQSSLCSILNDDELGSADAATAMQGSLDEFYAVVKESISKWSSGKAASIVKKSEEVSEADLKVMKAAVERLNETIEKAGKGTEPDYEDPKGDEEEMGMKIDKSKMTDAERAFLESIEKRYGTDDGAVPDNGGGTAAQASAGQAAALTMPATGQPGQTVEKSAPAQAEGAPAPQTDAVDDIYKGLHPAVKAELEELKKFREASEDRELAEVAKKYAIIGKKEEELIPVLKSLKAAGGTAYNDMIAVLDQAVVTVEKSGAFSEIGKSGHGGAADGSAWAEADAKAVELMKSRTGISKAQALDEVLMANPELAARCEKED